MDSSKKLCEVCGSNHRVQTSSHTHQLVCSKHRQQINKYYKSINPNTIPCEICGSKYSVNKCKQLNKYLCGKHYRQLKTQGKFLERSIKDSNKIIMYENKGYAEVELYNIKHEITGYALVDIQDISRIKKYKWSLNDTGYVRAFIKGHHCSLHRFVLNIDDSKTIIDHKSGNRLDNRKSNLRECTASQNTMNAELRSDNNSGVVGVNYYKRDNKWMARISSNGKNIFLGYFTNFEDAVKARKSAEEKYFGEFSYDNSRKSSEQAG